MDWDIVSFIGPDHLLMSFTSQWTWYMVSFKSHSHHNGHVVSFEVIHITVDISHSATLFQVWSFHSFIAYEIFCPVLLISMSSPICHSLSTHVTFIDLLFAHDFPANLFELSNNYVKIDFNLYKFWSNLTNIKCNYHLFFVQFILWLLIYIILLVVITSNVSKCVVGKICWRK